MREHVRRNSTMFSFELAAELTGRSVDQVKEMVERGDLTATANGRAIINDSRLDYHSDQSRTGAPGRLQLHDGHILTSDAVCQKMGVLPEELSGALDAGLLTGGRTKGGAVWVRVDERLRRWQPRYRGIDAAGRREPLEK